MFLSHARTYTTTRRREKKKKEKVRKKDQRTESERGTMVSREHKRTAALHEKLQQLRSITNSHAVIINSLCLLIFLHKFVVRDVLSERRI